MHSPSWGRQCRHKHVECWTREAQRLRRTQIQNLEPNNMCSYQETSQHDLNSKTFAWL